MLKENVLSQMLWFFIDTFKVCIPVCKPLLCYNVNLLSNLAKPRVKCRNYLTLFPSSLRDWVGDKLKQPLNIRIKAKSSTYLLFKPCQLCEIAASICNPIHVIPKTQKNSLFECATRVSFT